MSRRPTETSANAGAKPPVPHLGDDDNAKRRGPGAPAVPIWGKKHTQNPGGPGARSPAVIPKTKPQTRRPSLYRVLLLNDDYTPMEFVVHVLERFFHKDHEAAQRI